MAHNSSLTLIQCRYQHDSQDVDNNDGSFLLTGDASSGHLKVWDFRLTQSMLKHRIWLAGEGEEHTYVVNDDGMLSQDLSNDDTRGQGGVYSNDENSTHDEGYTNTTSTTAAGFLTRGQDGVYSNDEKTTHDRNTNATSTTAAGSLTRGQAGYTILMRRLPTMKDTPTPHRRRLRNLPVDFLEMLLK